MQTYSALIQLASSRENEVRRTGLTAPEMHMLAYTHGPDAVLQVEATGEIDVDMEQERERLALVYGVDDDGPRVNKVFGVAGALPTVYKGIEFEEPKPAPKRRTSAKQPDAVDKAANATRELASELAG